MISSISKEADDTQQGETMGVTIAGQLVAFWDRCLQPGCTKPRAWLRRITAAMVMVLALVLLHPGFKNAVKPVN
ncbi:MAG: hypothetical protein R2857_01290 [Vampirovibrionales bacterium]